MSGLASVGRLKLAETRVMGGWASMRTLGFANLSTCALELAELRMVGGWQEKRGLVLPFQALVCLDWKNQGWQVVGHEQGGSVLTI